MKGICEVCRIVHKDTTEKEVFYCDTCKALICSKCNNDLPARIEAFGVTTINKVINWFKN